LFESTFWINRLGVFQTEMRKIVAKHYWAVKTEVIWKWEVKYGGWSTKYNDIEGRGFRPTGFPQVSSGDLGAYLMQAWSDREKHGILCAHSRIYRVSHVLPVFDICFCKGIFNAPVTLSRFGSSTRPDLKIGVDRG
jgi:hypothetical protein